MEVYEISPNGFCNGVIRAIKVLEEALSNTNTKKPIYMIGYLVHNKDICDRYSKFVTFIEDLDAIENVSCGTIVITAHGISPLIRERIKRMGLDIIDTTCPKVLLVHLSISDYINKGYEVFVIGDKNHPEVKGYLGISDKVHIYENNLTLPKKSFVTTQTTLLYDKVSTQLDVIKENNPNVIISKDICKSTYNRQKGLLDSLDLYDYYIVIGDKLSNNCQSLLKLIINSGKEGILINSYKDLINTDLHKYKKIGVTAGASTPKEYVKECIEYLKTL